MESEQEREGPKMGQLTWAKRQGGVRPGDLDQPTTKSFKTRGKVTSKKGSREMENNRKAGSGGRAKNAAKVAGVKEITSENGGSGNATSVRLELTGGKTQKPESRKVKKAQTKWKGPRRKQN